MKKLQKKVCAAWLLVMMLVLSACGAPTEAAAVMDSSQAKAEDTAWEAPAMEEAEMEELMAEAVNTAQIADSSMTVEEVEQYVEKIIYSGSVYLETTEFDQAVAALDQAVKDFDGFVQSSNITGNTYYEENAVAVRDRRAYYTVRIPAEKFDAFMACTEGLGNVTNSGRTAENVTSQYTDYEAQLTSLNTQEERLLAMLAQSEDLDSLIALEARLSEVRYEIESIERSLRNLDQKISFSTVDLEIQEVELYTPTVAVQRSFGEKLSASFTKGWSRFGRQCQNFVIDLVGSLPTILLLVVLVGGGILVICKVRKKIRAKRQTPPQTEQNQDT